MILGFLKNKLNIEVKTFKSIEDFHEDYIYNDYSVILTSQLYILNLKIKNINIFIVEEEHLTTMQDIIYRSLMIGDNKLNGKNCNSLCRIINEIHSRPINGEKIKIFLPAILTNEKLLKEINISRENCLINADNYRTRKNIIFEFLRLKCTLNLNNR